MKPGSPFPPGSSQYGFNALRLLFAGLVIVSHSFELIGLPDPIQAHSSVASLGQLAVDGFFLISGFLITQSWLSDPSIKRFLARRVLRLYPAFIVASIFSAFIAGPLGAVPHQYFAEFDYPAFVRGVLTLQVTKTPPVFAGTSIELVNGALWTISFEARCYLLAMLVGLVGLFARRHLLLALTIFLGLWICWSAPPDGSMDGQHWLLGLKALRVSDSMVWFSALFLTGSCYAQFRDRIRFSAPVWVACFVVLCLCLARVATMRLGILLAGAYVVFGLSAAHGMTTREKRSSQTDISYGIYLYGWPVQKLLAWYFPTLPAVGILLLTLLIAGTLAIASWRFIEAPALRLKPKAARRSGPPGAGSDALPKVGA